MSDKISEIIKDKLYLTSLSCLKSINLVLSLNINIIVSIMEFNPFEQIIKEYSEIKFVYYKADDEDDFNISQYFEPFNNLMCENQNKKILVHCYSGISRSTTLVMSYLLNDIINTKTEKLIKKIYTIDKILKKVKKYRSVVSPNDGFMKQLCNYRENLINNKFFMTTIKN